jgi:N-acetylglucosaminyldiphosphoundecaprenol N-acetyl-beta-D-mannosaminyltransferase
MYSTLQTLDCEPMVNTYHSLTLFGYPIYVSPLDQLDINKKCFITSLNQYSFMVAEHDKTFKEAIVNSDIVIPDGVGIVAAFRILNGLKIKKIAGADLHRHLLSELSKKGGRCFYLGADDNTLQEIKKRLAREYPSIKMGYFSPPYKPIFSEADNRLMLDKINHFKPDILFVGMTAPKQEKWSYTNKNKIDADIICSIGAVFDYYGGTAKRPGKFWISIGMEWFMRFLLYPGHTWKRYFYYGPPFVFRIFREKAINIFK